MMAIANRTIFEPGKVWKTFRPKQRDLAGSNYESINNLLINMFFGHINNLYELGNLTSFVPNVLDTTGYL